VATYRFSKPETGHLVVSTALAVTATCEAFIDTARLTLPTDFLRNQPLHAPTSGSVPAWETAIPHAQDVRWGGQARAFGRGLTVSFLVGRSAAVSVTYWPAMRSDGEGVFHGLGRYAAVFADAIVSRSEQEPRR
jgi:hypothetical protein